MISIRNTCGAVLLLILLITLCACTVTRSPDVVFASQRSNSEVCRVAVFPFVDEADDPGIAHLSSRVFRNELIRSGAVNVSSEGAVRNFMTQKKMHVDDLMSTRVGLYSELADRLQVEAIIRGTIIKSGVDKTGKDGTIPYVDMKVEMVDAQSGQLLVDTFHQRRGDEYRKIMHIGIVRTKTGLLVKTSEEIIDQWMKRGLLNCQL